QAFLDAGLEAALLTPGIVEAEDRHEVRLADRTAERATRQVRQDLLRARALFDLARGIAREDPLPALGRLADAARVVGAENLEPVQAPDVRHALSGHERLQQVVALGEAARDERGCDLPAPRLHLEADALEPLADRVDALDLLLVENQLILGTADLLGEDGHAVEGHDQLVLVVEPPVRVTAELGARD